jgi:hypothetical protein
MPKHPMAQHAEIQQIIWIIDQPSRRIVATTHTFRNLMRNLHRDDPGAPLADLTPQLTGKSTLYPGMDRPY